MSQAVTSLATVLFCSWLLTQGISLVAYQQHYSRDYESMLRAANVL